MNRVTISIVVALVGLILACSGRGHAPADSGPLWCYQNGLYDLLNSCDGPTLTDVEECAEGEVRINCTHVLDGDTEEYGNDPELEADRCAPAEYIQSICGEVIPCEVKSNETIYVYCG
ncbi:MAG: hypothetical protein RIT28_642 [Pseudomonadota bacterium]